MSIKVQDRRNTCVNVVCFLYFFFQRLGIKTWCELLDLSSTLLHQIQPEDYAKVRSSFRLTIDSNYDSTLICIICGERQLYFMGTSRVCCCELISQKTEYTCYILLFTQILSRLRSLLDKWPCLELREAAAQFLGKCGSKEIPEHLEVRD